MKNKARIVRNTKDSVYLEITDKDEKYYFEICPLAINKDKVVGLSDYFLVNLTK